MTGATATPSFLPQPVSDLEIAFPATVRHLMPSYDEIPEEYRHFHGTVWNRLVGAWFFRGFKSLTVTPRDGIDQNMAMRHLRCIMGSFEPKHEHKEAAVAYLMSLWFEGDPSWEAAK